jgi:osmotically-inducible protein OsmY
VAAARAVMYLKGLTALTNGIFLTATAPGDGLKAEIEAAMQRNAQLDGREITVEVNGGDVTLSGMVHSWAELRQAGYVVWSAAGVTSVKNGLAIAS